MNPCGHYKIYAGEVRENGQIEVRLHDVDNKARTFTMILDRADWGSVSIGAELEIVSYGVSQAEKSES